MINMNLNNKKGVIFIFMLFAMVLLISFGSIFILRTVNENKMAKVERERAKSFYIAEGGSQEALNGLNNLVNNYMFNTINNYNPSSLISITQNYAGSPNSDGVGFLVLMARDPEAPDDAILTINGEQAEYDSGSINFGSGNYQYKLIITEKIDPVTVTPDTWEFPYNYRIESSGASEGIAGKILLSGDFTVRVQRDNFAKYALFTNSQTMPSGTNVWFTHKTDFNGPVHTNGRFNIALNPSGTFDGFVSQHEQMARFYNSGWTILLDDDHNAALDVPTFNAGFCRGVDTISLSSSVQKQDLIDQSQGGQTFAGNGIFLANDGVELEGGVYVNGDSTVDLSVDGNNNAVYTIVQGATTKVITVDETNNQTDILTVGVGTETYSGIPDGIDDVGTIIFVDGNITSLGGTVQEDTEMTISGENNIVITNNLRYSKYVAAVGTQGESGYIPPYVPDDPADSDYGKNLLGLVTWSGDVLIGTSAPDDVNIHATLLAKDGIFQVDQYNNYIPRGVATLLGGVITDNYGAFGLFNGSTGEHVSGYGRNFIYDARMAQGNSPPYFPSLNTFIAFTNDITDKIVWQEGGF